MNRIGFFRNGWLLDEVVLSDASFAIRRAGKARYEVRLAHFEHIDRNYYYLGFSKAGEHWMLHFAGAGYLKLAPVAHCVPQLVELHLDAAGTPAQLRDALAFALRVVPNRLVFVPVVELPGPPLRPGQILVTVTRRKGDFPLTVSFSALEQELPIAARLSKVLRRRVLISDCTANPYTWTLVTSEGSILAADVDVESLAEEALVLVWTDRTTL